MDDCRPPIHQTLDLEAERLLRALLYRAEAGHFIGQIGGMAPVSLAESFDGHPERFGDQLDAGPAPDRLQCTRLEQVRFEIHRLAEADVVQEVGRASLDMAHGHLPGRFRPPLQH